LGPRFFVGFIVADKKDTVSAIIAAINKGWRGAAVRLADGAKSDVAEVITTGIDVIDKYVIGCGGLPVGRFSEVFSEEGVGKTSFMLSCAAAAQRVGGVAIIIETEFALDRKRAKTFGVNWDDLILLQPGHLDDVCAQAALAIKSIPPGVGPVFLGWDSIAATPSKEEVDLGLQEGKSWDTRARGISQALRVLGPLLARHRVHLMMINQTRDKIGVMFGNKVATPGGHAPKFHCSLRLQLFNGKAVKDSMGQHVAKPVSFMAIKNKMAPPWRKAQVKLDFSTGWDNDWATLTHAKNLKLVPPRSRDLKEAIKALEAAEWSKAGEGAQDVSDDDTDLPSEED